MAMLLDKLAGRPFRSELALLQPRAVAPAPALGDTTASRLALITSGRLVPRGNPDRMPHRHSRHRFEYELPTAGLMPEEWESIHPRLPRGRGQRRPERRAAARRRPAAPRRGADRQPPPRFQSLAGVGTPDSAAREIATELADSLRRESAHGASMVAT